jgi:hypothetical protein
LCFLWYIYFNKFHKGATKFHKGFHIIHFSHKYLCVFCDIFSLCFLCNSFSALVPLSFTKVHEEKLSYAMNFFLNLVILQPIKP